MRGLVVAYPPQRGPGRSVRVDVVEFQAQGRVTEDASVQILNRDVGATAAPGAAAVTPGAAAAAAGTSASPAAGAGTAASPRPRPSSSMARHAKERKAASRRRSGAADS